jgi:NAD kinase
MFDKIVLVTRKTRLEELVERFNTREQAKFYIEHMGLDFGDYDREHQVYVRAVSQLRRQLEGLLSKLQVIDRGFLPNFLFTPQDLVMTVGQDGLVVNTAKYLDGQPIVAVNPDAGRYDGILLPFAPDTARKAVASVLEDRAGFHQVTMAEITLNDGQRLLAFNDFLIGQRTHISARYRVTWRGQTERQSSSGVLISTGAGSTGWLSSAQNMAAAVSRLLLGKANVDLPRLRLAWDDPRLVFVVREPFLSRSSQVRLTAGLVEPGDEMQFESQMPDGGVIFSDGVESDALAFNSGTVATLRTAARKTRLVAAPGVRRRVLRRPAAAAP